MSFVRVRLTVLCAAVTLAGVSVAGGQPLTIQHKATSNLSATSTDQFGTSFTIAGLSGVTYIGPGPGASHRFVAVMDNSNLLVRIDAGFDGAGAFTSVNVASGLRLAESRDFEGIGWTGPAGDSVLLAEEGTPAVHEFDLATGARLRSLPTPAVFGARRANFGFESLTRGSAIGELWTANEEALTVDGPISTPSAGTTVRLLAYRDRPGAVPATRQFAYRTEPLHGQNISGARSGISDLVALPDGRLLVLERSFALASPLFLTRIYSIDLTGATEVSSFTGGLSGQQYTRVNKTLVYSATHNNLEGLCVGPRLADGSYVLVGIVDDGDPVSINQVLSFRITGVGSGAGRTAVLPESIFRR